MATRGKEKKEAAKAEEKEKAEKVDTNNGEEKEHIQKELNGISGTQGSKEVSGTNRDLACTRMEGTGLEAKAKEKTQT